jgi:hypothetical protein
LITLYLQDLFEKCPVEFAERQMGRDPFSKVWLILLFMLHVCIYRFLFCGFEPGNSGSAGKIFAGAPTAGG